MKRTITILLSILITASLLLPKQTNAQAPEKISYQAVIRDGSNNLITNQTVGLRISILQGSTTGTDVYVETHTPISNINGLVSIEIGGGSIISGSFSIINWANGPYFIKSESDPLGGSNYTIIGVSQILSVPFALYANTANSLIGGIIETDPVFVNHAANSITQTSLNSWNNAYGWGNHALAGYISNYYESDPIWTVASANYYTKTNMQNAGTAQLHFNNLTNTPITLSGYGITDGMTTSHPANAITNININNWNTAFGWGNHANAGYLTNFTESDPVWTSVSSNYFTKNNLQTSGTAQVHFNNLTNKPTSLAGYGISDGLSTAGGIVTGSITASGSNAALSGFNASLVNSTTSTYTLTAADNGKIITISNTNPITLIIPAGLSDGFNCLVIQGGDGQITFTQSGSVINNRNAFTKTAGKYAIATVVHLGGNVIITSGDMQ